MEFKIRETGEVKELCYLVDGICCFADITYGCDFEWDDADEIHIISQDDYDWWNDYITQNQRIDGLVDRLRQVFSAGRVNDVVNFACDNNFEHHAAQKLAALKEEFGSEFDFSNYE